MGIERLFLAQIEEQHLLLLNKAVAYSVDASVEQWLRWVANGAMGLFDLYGKGLMGLRPLPQLMCVEFLVGKDLRPHARGILDFVKGEAEGHPVETFVTRRGLVRFYEGLGFRPLATWMRCDNGR